MFYSPGSGERNMRSFEATFADFDIKIRTNNF